MLSSSKLFYVEPGIKRIRSIPGLRAKLARSLKLTRAAITQWERIPAERAVEVSRISGIPLHELRPDLWPVPNTREK